MRFKLEIIICIFLWLTNTLFPQENKSFNFNTNSIWLLEDYYNRLIQEQSPQKLYGLADGQIMAIEFNDKENYLQFLNFYELTRHNYSIVTNNKIEVSYQREKMIESTITFEEINGIPKIILENKDERKIFVRLNERYQTVNDINKFINDCLITGNYVSTEDGTLKISFASDGTLIGLGKFNHYLISITSDEVPKTFNTIAFWEIKKTKTGTKWTNMNYFYWEKKDNRVILYEISEPTPNAKIQGKFIELVKVGF
jgi:hypothetical protein